MSDVYNIIQEYKNNLESLYYTKLDNKACYELKNILITALYKIQAVYNNLSFNCNDISFEPDYDNNALKSSNQYTDNIIKWMNSFEAESKEGEWFNSL